MFSKGINFLQRAQGSLVIPSKIVTLRTRDGGPMCAGGIGVGASELILLDVLIVILLYLTIFEKQ